jgi:hypothetical protein
MPFAPGQSGNPGGQPKVTAEVRELARQHGPDAIAALASIMHDSGAQPSARVAAAIHLLDRGFGKPKQEIEASGSLSIAVVTGIDRAPDQS